MLKTLKGCLMVIGFVFLWASISVTPLEASTVSAPTVLKINNYKSYSITDPVISGVTPKDTNVLVYVNDVFAGNAVIQDRGTESDSFYFQVFNLSEGIHKAYLIAEEKNGLGQSAPSVIFDLVVGHLPAPTLVVPNSDTITGKVKPLIEGFTKSGSFVHLYIDGVYNGKTEVVEHESGTAHFDYTPFLGLSVGKHRMWAVSEDLSGRKSKVSGVVEFNIERKMPAPILVADKIKNSANNNHPMVIGLAKNNSKIKVFVNHKYDGEFSVENHVSGTANFAYTINKKLATGKHFVYVTALDNRGKESHWSNIVYFETGQKAIRPIISDLAAEEQKNGDQKSEDSQSGSLDKSEINKKALDYLVFADSYKKDDQVRLSTEQYRELGEILKNKSELPLSASEISDLEKLLASKDTNKEDTSQDKGDENKDDSKSDEVSKDKTATSSEAKGGLVDEKKDPQDKLGWNAFIFILFLFAVIAWIFWVNRELIKEKQEQEKEKKE